MVDKKEVGKSAAALVRKIILGIALIGIVLASAWLVNAYIIEPKRHREENIEPETTTSGTDTQPTAQSKPEEDLKAKYSALLNMNPDFVGKLYIEAIEETGFNVVQCGDNETYLTTGFKGESTRYGTLFADYRNNVKDFDTNTIIYGHNMRDGSQLGSLSLYSNLENYKAYPTIKFNTIHKNNTWKVFAAFIINTRAADDNGYVFPYLTINFPSENKFLEFIDDVKTRSYFINDSVDIQAGDKILTLSTCDTVFKDARFVLMARLVRDGESDEVDVSTARENENQRFPQAWYNVKHKTNPFKDAKKFN